MKYLESRGIYEFTVKANNSVKLECFSIYAIYNYDIPDVNGRDEI